MSDWMLFIEHQIREAIGDGNTAHLPGSGKPLKLKDDLTIPDEYRLANRIMLDNDLTPAWMMMAQDIEKLRNQIHAHLENAARRYLGEVGDAGRAGNRMEELQAEEQWMRTQSEISAGVTKHNQMALNYNLMIPGNIPRKPLLQADVEIENALKSATRID